MIELKIKRNGLAEIAEKMTAINKLKGWFGWSENELAKTLKDLFKENNDEFETGGFKFRKTKRQIKITPTVAFVIKWRKRNAETVVGGSKK
jgi:hypothetical protein